jgi:hypothetical protein
MSANTQRVRDISAIEIANTARAIAENTRDRVHWEFQKFERVNTEQHRVVSSKVDALREHISGKVGEVHKRIDRLVILTFCAVIGLLTSVVAWLLDNSPPWRNIG